MNACAHTHTRICICVCELEVGKKVGGREAGMAGGIDFAE